MAETRFGGGSPVARYWLANCRGFVVQGAARGVVEEMIRDADPFVTTRLVVRTRARRRVIVPATSISSVDPSERVLVVEGRSRPAPARPARAATAARKQLAATIPAAASTWTAARSSATPHLHAGARASSVAWSAATAAAVTGLRAAWSAVRRNVPRAAHAARRGLAPAVHALVRSFGLLLGEAAGTVATVRGVSRRGGRAR